MKYLKMVGSAALAAMALMIFAPGPASATTLDNGWGEALGWGSVIDASLIGGTARIESTSGSVLDTCTGGTIQWLITDAGGAGKAVKGEVAKAGLTWSGCTSTTDTTAGGSIEISHTSGANGTVKAGPFEVTINSLGTSCTYGASNKITTPVVHFGTLEGGNFPNLKVNTVTEERTEDKFLCPNDVVFNAEYRITTPIGLTVTS